MKRMILSILLVAVVLLGVSFALNDTAAANAQAHHLELMQMLLPGSTTFTRVEYTGEDTNIVDVHKAENGYVIKTRTYGYADYITMQIGVNMDGSVTGLVVSEAHETLGLGSKILTDHEFLAQFLNGTGSFAIAVGEADAFSGATGETASEGESTDVDGITGATVSSKAVARCVNSAIAYVTGADAVSAATTWGG